MTTSHVHLQRLNVSLTALLAAAIMITFGATVLVTPLVGFLCGLAVGTPSGYLAGSRLADRSRTRR